MEVSPQMGMQPPQMGMQPQQMGFPQMGMPNMDQMNMSQMGMQPPQMGMQPPQMGMEQMGMEQMGQMGQMGMQPPQMGMQQMQQMPQMGMGTNEGELKGGFDDISFKPNFDIANIPDINSNNQINVNMPNLSNEQVKYIFDKYGKNHEGAVEFNGGNNKIDIPKLNDEQIKYIINNYKSNDVISYISLPDIQNIFSLEKKKK